MMLVVRVAFFLTLGLGLISGGIWLYNNPGLVHIQWLDYEIDTTMSVVIAFMIISLTAVGFFWNFIKFILTLPWRIKNHWQQQQTEKGFTLLYQFLANFEQWNFDTIHKDIDSIKKAFNEPILAIYLEGITARRQGYHSLAQEKFYALTRIPESSTLGMSAALTLVLQDQPPLVAWSLYDQLPKDFKLSSTVMKRMIETALLLSKFDEASHLLTSLKKHKTISTVEVHYYTAKIALARSEYSRDTLKNIDAAYVSAQEAYDSDPTPEAGYNILPYLIENGKTRKARETLRTIWQQQPSLKILPYLVQIDDGYTTPLAQYGLLKEWSESTSDQTAKFTTLAQLALNAGLWGESYTWLERIPMDNDTAKLIISLKAELELAENNNQDKALQYYRDYFRDANNTALKVLSP